MGSVGVGQDAGQNGGILGERLQIQIQISNGGGGWAFSRRPGFGWVRASNSKFEIEEIEGQLSPPFPCPRTNGFNFDFNFKFRINGSNPCSKFEFEFEAVDSFNRR